MKNDTIYKPLVDAPDDSKDENIPNSREEEYEWGKHPNSLKALKKNQFPKGVSGNVMGKKPTFESLAKQLKKLGEEETFDYNNDSQGSRKQQVLLKIWFGAIRGDMKKIQLLAWLGCLD